VPAAGDVLGSASAPERAPPGRTVIETASLRLAALNVVGGVLVLVSYVFAFGFAPEVRGALWGGVPESWRPVYTVNMLLAAAGYFPFTWLFVLRTRPAELLAATGVPYAGLGLLYGLVLIPSALWLPLTAQMLADPSPGRWIAVRATLFAVALGATGLLWLALRLARARGGAARWAAFAGTLPFFTQTAILDALVWPAWFPH